MSLAPAIALNGEVILWKTYSSEASLVLRLATQERSSLRMCRSKGMCPLLPFLLGVLGAMNSALRVSGAIYTYSRDGSTSSYSPPRSLLVQKLRTCSRRSRSGAEAWISMSSLTASTTIWGRVMPSSPCSSLLLSPSLFISLLHLPHTLSSCLSASSSSMLMP